MYVFLLSGTSIFYLEATLFAHNPLTVSPFLSYLPTKEDDATGVPTIDPASRPTGPDEDDSTGAPSIDPASRPSGPDVSSYLKPTLFSNAVVSHLPFSLAFKGGRRYGYADDRSC
jgi:hypothetical protein